MTEDFKDINEYLEVTEKTLVLYKSKISRFEDAIKLMEEENIPIPEAVLGSLDFYKAAYEKFMKSYNNMLTLRNKKIEECQHDYEITRMGDGKQYNIGRCKICGHVEYIKN